MSLLNKPEDIYLLKARTDCPVEKILRWTKRMSDQTSNKHFFEKN